MELELYLKDDEWELEYINHDRIITRGIVFQGDYFYFVKVNRNDDFGCASYIETAGGGKEDNEQLEDSIQRELSEELGVTVSIIAKIGMVSDYYNKIHRHNLNHYFLCEIKDFGTCHLTEDEIEKWHLSTIKLTYEEALNEYQKNMDTRIGRLVAKREIPILKRAKEILDDKREKA